MIRILFVFQMILAIVACGLGGGEPRSGSQKSGNSAGENLASGNSPSNSGAPGVGEDGKKSCPSDAMLYCVEKAPGEHEELTVGRDENCEFPTVENAVAYENCGLPSDGESCEQLETTVKKTIEELNYCDTDKDCVVTYGSCPFGCYIYRNNQADLAQYQSALASFHKLGCQTCDYDCAKVPVAVCRDNRCVSQSD